MLGIDPATNTLVQDPQARNRQALLNIKLIAQSEGASLQDCVRLTVYINDLYRFAPMVDKAQEEFWGKPPYPPRTMTRSSACSTVPSWRSKAPFTPGEEVSRLVAGFPQ
jgi:enamine deaminase RidA (YjgF/YER057c/UK114 family)